MLVPSIILVRKNLKSNSIFEYIVRDFIYGLGRQLS